MIHLFHRTNCIRLCSIKCMLNPSLKASKLISWKCHQWKCLSSKRIKCCLWMNARVYQLNWHCGWNIYNQICTNTILFCLFVEYKNGVLISKKLVASVLTCFSYYVRSVWLWKGREGESLYWMDLSIKYEKKARENRLRIMDLCVKEIENGFCVKELIGSIV